MALNLAQLPLELRIEEIECRKRTYAIIPKNSKKSYQRKSKWPSNLIETYWSSVKPNLNLKLIKNLQEGSQPGPSSDSLALYFTLSPHRRNKAQSHHKFKNLNKIKTSKTETLRNQINLVALKGPWQPSHYCQLWVKAPLNHQTIISPFSVRIVEEFSSLVTQ